MKSRIAARERGNKPVRKSHMRATLSDEYLRARRLLRLWPVVGLTEEDLWGNTGDFIHDTLKVSTEELGQDDILEVFRPLDTVPSDLVVNEVLVVFKIARIQDLVISHSANLANRVDGDGRPTAGTRIEIPPELKETFKRNETAYQI